MDFDKDNFEEENELAPLEEEEGGDVDEVAEIELDESVSDDDAEEEVVTPKRNPAGPKRGSTSASGSSAGKSARKSSVRKPARKASAGRSKTTSKKSARSKRRGKAGKKRAKKGAKGKRRR